MATLRNQSKKLEWLEEENKNNLTKYQQSIKELEEIKLKFKIENEFRQKITLQSLEFEQEIKKLKVK